MFDNASETGQIQQSHNENFNFKSTVINDIKNCYLSREVSLLARKDVLSGRGKFAIYGDGKELPQIALSKVFRKGDHRSGYYRDQTIMFCLGLCTVENYFSQLYTDTENDPFSGGRQMNAHFSTPYIDDNGDWLDQINAYNISADISCTAGQMARAVGLALASKKYRELSNIKDANKFSNNGNEICYCTIGDASTAEGAFWETINAVSIMQVPLLISIWDDGYGISVPAKYQIAKESVSEIASGFEYDELTNGIRIYKVKGWDYQELCRVYEEVSNLMRIDHVPAIIHVEELTQPQGHSTSGSHERYKSKERLQWERERDCLLIFEEWVISNQIATKEELNELRKEIKQHVKEQKNLAWKKYKSQVDTVEKKVLSIIEIAKKEGVPSSILDTFSKKVKAIKISFRTEFVKIVRQYYLEIPNKFVETKQAIEYLLASEYSRANENYNTNLYFENGKDNMPVVKPTYESEKTVPGYQVLNKFFEKAFEKDNRLFAFGEDVGQIGDVNQGFSGLQEKFGKKRIFDTGIREWTIVGQAIGMGLRGLRPIAEIQYLDYLVYGLGPLTDDLATLLFRTDGKQTSPAIIRTRGHRLEGIWHSGSPISMILGSLRGIYVCVPRNMTQAAGIYNSLLKSKNPALVIEVLNGYRQREKMPTNVGEYNIPLGVPDVLHTGNDLTIVTYGACVRVVEAAVERLAKLDISVELIDVQTLIPFDKKHIILDSIKKTNKVMFVDEDVPGGTTAYMMQKVLVEQKGFQYLDSSPITISAKEHRSPYGSDGDYFTKPNTEDIVSKAYHLMQEYQPNRFPLKLIDF